MNVERSFSMTRIQKTKDFAGDSLSHIQLFNLVTKKRRPINERPFWFVALNLF
ncbi:MAG: hypothetical protein ACI857_001830 [Arenicella sp.]|jgi:hypothetical protein